MNRGPEVACGSDRTAVTRVERRMNRVGLLLASCVLLAACSSPRSTALLDETALGTAAPGPSIDRASVRANLAAHRAEQIARLHAYAEAGQFPHNTAVAPSLHMFRDAAGRYCAVANLVHRDGRDDLVEATVRDQNDLAIADVHGGPMMDWVLASGLTQEELVRIQAPAPFIGRNSIRPIPSPGPVQVAVDNVPVAAKEAGMDAAIHAHVTQMEAELRDAGERSLDVAVERWVAHRAQGPTPPA
jgi:hypothetical protein